MAKHHLNSFPQQQKLFLSALANKEQMLVASIHHAFARWGEPMPLAEPHPQARVMHARVFWRAQCTDRASSPADHRSHGSGVLSATGSSREILLPTKQNQSPLTW